MNLKYKKQASCPSDELLLAYKSRKLSGRDYEKVVCHLLFCDACLEDLRQLPDDIDEEAPTEPSDFEAELESTPELAEAIEKFRAWSERRRETPAKTLAQVGQEGGLKVGQIWRTRFDGIALPGRETEKSFSVTDLNSKPHLVVITEAESRTGKPYGNYHIIQVAPVSAETEYATEGDFVIKEEESPLGYSFMIELWNEQSMLRENLDCCLASFDAVGHRAILDELEKQREKILSKVKKPISLEETVMKGLYHDPIMRFRAHEYEETAYLRVPVEALLTDKEEATEVGAKTERESSSEAGLVREVSSHRQRPAWLRVIQGLKTEVISEGQSPILAAHGEREPIRLAAQEQVESGWPLQVEADAENFPSPIQLKFDRLGPALVVECVGPPEGSQLPEDTEVLVQVERTGKEVHLVPGGKAILGPLEDFHLTSKSSRDEIYEALVSAGLEKPSAKKAK